MPLCLKPTSEVRGAFEDPCKKGDWSFGLRINQEVVNRILRASLARALDSKQIDRALPSWGWGREVSGSLISFRHESEQETEKRLKRNMPGLLTYLTYTWY